MTGNDKYSRLVVRIVSVVQKLPTGSRANFRVGTPTVRMRGGLRSPCALQDQDTSTHHRNTSMRSETTDSSDFYLCKSQLTAFLYQTFNDGQTVSDITDVEMYDAVVHYQDVRMALFLTSGFTMAQKVLEGVTDVRALR